MVTTSYLYHAGFMLRLYAGVPGTKLKIEKTIEQNITKDQIKNNHEINFVFRIYFLRGSLDALSLPGRLKFRSMDALSLQSDVISQIIHS